MTEPKARNKPRFLFVVPPLTGHTNPAVSVGAELVARGHEVAWAGHPGSLQPLLPADATIFPVLAGDLHDSREHGLRGAAALKFFWEDFVLPLAHAMLPGTEAAIESFAPDVVVADQQAIAGAVAARRYGKIWVTSATTPAELVRPLATMPKVEEWVSAQLAVFGQPVDLRFSEQLVLVFTTPSLMGDTSGFGDHYVFTGPALTGRADSTPFPWDWLDPGRRHVLVSLGTLNGPAGERFFRVVTEALDDDLQAVVVGPPREDAPENILFAERVPQLALLPHLDAVVSHGGHNTVCESLAHGLPLVVTPIRDDQPIVAQQVADAGAGIRLRFGRLRPAELRDAVRTVLDDASYRAAAERIRDSFATAGGARAAADHLEKLL